MTHDVRFIKHLIQTYFISFFSFMSPVEENWLMFLLQPLNIFLNKERKIKLLEWCVLTLLSLILWTIPTQQHFLIGYESIKSKLTALLQIPYRLLHGFTFSNLIQNSLVYKRSIENQLCLNFLIFIKVYGNRNKPSTYCKQVSVCRTSNSKFTETGFCPHNTGSDPFSAPPTFSLFGLGVAFDSLSTSSLS